MILSPKPAIPCRAKKGISYPSREERRIAASLKVSGLPRGMRLESFDYLFQPAVEKSRVEFLASCDYIRRAENVLLFGPPDPKT